MSTSIIQDKDQWSAFADDYKKGVAMAKLSNAPTEKLFEQMDKAFPFSCATAILDVGSGPGVTIGRVIEDYGEQLREDVRLIASDFSTGMISQVLEIKKQKALDTSTSVSTSPSTSTSALWNRLEAQVLDAHTLEGIPDASISHITGTMIYNLVANGRQALEAAHRVLQPGGVIGMTLGAGAEWMEIMSLSARLIRGSSAPSFTPPPSYSTLSGITSEFTTVGFTFTPHSITSVSSTMDVTNIKTVLDFFVRGKNPGAMFFIKDYSAQEVQRFCEEAERIVRERYPEEPRVLKGSVVVAVGRKM